MIRRIVRDLEATLPAASDPNAVLTKIAVSRERLDYFTKGSLSDKLDAKRDHLRGFLVALPAPAEPLFGTVRARPTSSPRSSWAA